MTCIVGIEHEGGVWIGADSASVSGWEKRETALSKVFCVGEFLIGYTTSSRMGQLLQYQLVVPKQNIEGDMAYMVTVFVEAVRECLRNGGFTKIENFREEGGVFLVGYRGNLYTIEGDFQVNRNREGYAAVGAGEACALGSLHTTQYDPSLSPDQKVRLALEAAAAHNVMVTGPFTVRRNKGEEWE